MTSQLLSAGLTLPVVASPLFIVSGPDLVVAQCTSGIIGSFPSLNARPAAALDEWLESITERLARHDAAHPERPAAPYAVNLITHRSNDRLHEDLATVVRHRVPIVITSLAATAEVNEAVHSYGGITLHDVTTVVHARKALARGADGLIAVAAGAGGHGGTWSPFALISEIRSFFDGPLILGGAIATGDAVLAARAAGADLAYVGSPFIATTEANAADRYKDLVVESTAADIVYTDLFTGIHGNYLRGSIHAAGLDPDNLGTRNSPSVKFTEDGAKPKAWRDVWGSGQGVGSVDAVVPTSSLVERLSTEYDSALKRLCAQDA